MAAQKEVVIFTDGGAEPNPGPGGYGVILRYGDQRRELFGGFRQTTNNRMELTAAIKGLQVLKEPCKVKLYSDSKYLVSCMTSGSVLDWERRGWRRRNTPVINADLWAALVTQCQTHEVHFEWVKGHAGHPENERCDELSMQFLNMTDLPVDEGYGSVPSPPPSLLPLADPIPLVVVRKKITDEGQPCRKCLTPVVKRSSRRKPRLGQPFSYEHYLFCPGCKTFYMVEEAKRLH